MLIILVWLATVTVVAASSKRNDCVLAGPDYPPPAKLFHSKPLSQTISTFEHLLDNNKLGFKPNDTAWGVALFSSKENKTLYEHYYTPPIDVGVEKVDRDSVFRIGSVSKVFSVWSFLIEVGDRYFNDPITKYVPELANLSAVTESDAVYDDINSVRWEEVTLGQLASQAAGIARDPTAHDMSLSLSVEQVKGLGFPVLNKTDVPVCDVEGLLRSCSRKEMLAYLIKQRPVYASSHAPAYSNTAFTLLGFAQEVITGKNFSTSIQNSIFDPLGMKNSAFEIAPKNGGVIPGKDAKAVGWDMDLGEAAPSGSLYSSTADMVNAGQAILQSTLLTQAETRRWLKPLIQTGYSSSPVGAPWEIRYLTSPNQHMVEAYTKQGDLGNYHAAMAFSPQHDLGWIVLTAAADAGAPDVRTELYNVFSDIFIPMAEDQAKREAVASFNGTYVDKATNSSVTILVGDNGRAGLGVPKLVSRGTEVIGPNSILISQFHAGETARLYPSQLRAVKKKSGGEGTYDSHLGFKATFFQEKKEGQLEDPCLMAWTALGAPAYGQRTLDDWVFELGENGRAEVVDIRMLRLRLKRNEWIE